MLRRRWACVAHAVLVVLWLVAGAAANAALVLDDSVQRIEAWPAVSVLSDPSKQLGLDAVRAASARFAPPRSAYATLGLRKDAVWLRLPLAVSAQSDGRWILDIDYAVLNRIDLHVLRDGQLVQHAVLGNLQPFSQRPLRSRSHAVALALQPGASYELFLRVETLGGMILPITLNKASAFHARAVNEQMLQGLLTGLGVCLLLYSLGQWVALREHLFVKYAVLIGGSLLFSITQFGLGAQYLWTDNTWMELHVAGLAALMASGGTFLFVEEVLSGPQTSRYFSRLMKLGAVLLFATGLAYALDAIHVHTVSTVVGSLGLMPALLGLPGAVGRARRGDSVGWYFLLAWAGYFVTTALMVGVIKGYVDVSPWAMHSFQIGATLDMLLFMRVLALRSKAVHVAARHATRERDVLHSLAHTDPLTGLSNRRGLNVTLTAALPRCTPENLLAVYMLDLDGFKQVNDQFGHDVGDELLIAVAARLQANLRTSDVVSRLGGDEFVVMASGLHNEQQARELGTHLLDAFREPFELARQRCSVGLTIGYVLVPLDGRDTAELLRRADAAMYAGKQGGKNSLRRGEAVAARTEPTLA
ncbi:diguanylate cyclase [Piscinibacter sp.]|jgi:diguanylate cyclase (GGDEF)-like protein|uniref:diguanylate cyclase n=1 Tax=Piscinibacter sp. TaxID=1903157 RepID=UPI002F3FBB06